MWNSRGYEIVLEMYLKGKHDDEWESFQYTTLQGGIVTKEELEQAKQDIDIRTFRQEFEGTFENYAGQVYYNFHPVESVKDYKLDLSKPLHIGMDFNVDPMSCCVAHIEKDKVYFVDKIVIYSSTSRNVKQIKTIGVAKYCLSRSCANKNKCWR